MRSTPLQYWFFVERLRLSEIRNPAASLVLKGAVRPWTSTVSAASPSSSGRPEGPHLGSEALCTTLPVAQPLSGADSASGSWLPGISQSVSTKTAQLPAPRWLPSLPRALQLGAGRDRGLSQIQFASVAHRFNARYGSRHLSTNAPDKTVKLSRQQALQLFELSNDGPAFDAQSLPTPLHPTASQISDEVNQRMQSWLDFRKKRLQALARFPRAEIEDPYHQSTAFTAPPKRFVPGGVAWGSLGEQAAPSVPVEQQKLLQVAVVGVPNAGKSSMVNALVGSKVAAVSTKTNTTVSTALGAFTEGCSQVAIFDTPGVVASRYTRGAEHQARVQSAWTVAGMCDLLLLIIDAHRQIAAPDVRVTQLVQELAEGPTPGWKPPPSILVLNKVDKFTGGDHTFASVTALGDSLKTLCSFEDVYPISVQTGTGMDVLRADLLGRAMQAEWVLNAGEVVGLSPAKLCEEVVREKVFERMYREVPYGVSFQRLAFRLCADGAVLAKFILVVPNQTVRSMLVGRNGATIGEIGIKARRDLEGIFQSRFHLFLDVRVRRN